MSIMRPSVLRRRLVLEQMQRVPDDGGGFTESWIQIATLFANIRPVSAGEKVENDRLAGRVTHEIMLRYRANVAPAMRFGSGPRAYEILAVIDVEERRRWLKCLCEERDL